MYLGTVGNPFVNQVWGLDLWLCLFIFVLIEVSLSKCRIHQWYCLSSLPFFYQAYELSLSVRAYNLIIGPRTISCDFDIDTCLWTQDKLDKLDWTLQSGPTSTAKTGPKADHTSGSKSKTIILTELFFQSWNVCHFIVKRLENNYML